MRLAKGHFDTSEATVDSLTTERMLRRGSSSNARPGKPPSSGLRLAQIISALSGACASTRFL